MLEKENKKDCKNTFIFSFSFCDLCEGSANLLKCVYVTAIFIPKLMRFTKDKGDNLNIKQ